MMIKFIILIISFVFVLLLLLSPFIFFGAIIYLMTLFIPHYITGTILLLIVYYLIISIFRFICFPASSRLIWFGMDQFSIIMKAGEYRKNLKLLMSVFLSLLAGTPISGLLDPEKELMNIRKTFEIQIRIYQNIISAGTKLSKGQQKMMDKLLELKTNLESTTVVRGEQKLSVWELLANGDQFGSWLSNNDLRAEFEDPIKAVKVLDMIQDFLFSLGRKAYSLYSADTFFHLNGLRMELEAEFNAKQYKVQTRDKKAILDCMFIPSTKLENQTENPGPTLIVCNPNGVLYQFIKFSSRLKFLDLGMNLFVWNYRGCYSSTGSPTPQRVCIDGEDVVNFVRSTLNVKKVGVYGCSIGGMFAAHIASKQNVDFLYIDRTFSSLSIVAKTSHGSVIAKLMNLLTCYQWNVDSVKNYLSAPCYKIFSHAAEEVVFDMQGAMLYGITSEILKARYLSETGNPTKFKKITFASKGVLVNLSQKMVCLQKLLFPLLLSREIEHYTKNFYTKVLSEPSFTTFFTSLRRICQAIREKPISTDGKISFGLFKHFCNRVNDDTTERLPSILTKYPKGSKLHLLESLPYELPIEFVKLMNDILSKIDVTGVNISRAFTETTSNKEQKELLKIYLVHLAVWGSYLPCYSSGQKGIRDPNYFRKQTISRLREVCEELTKYTSDNSIFFIPSLALQDIQTIIRQFEAIQRSLSEFVMLDEKNKDVIVEDRRGDVEIELIGENKSELNLSQQTSQGYLVPLNCGHMCSFNHAEFKLFEYHLRQARFI
eukprot:TRINITY_DN1838_c0_g1_i9.p1 TRINITY_DN1838_c0_g1~~TRINITY_DN1838_c0_g1_i9.p1  ORF type:complete len:771 (+),score=25.19 TRINITY_DN1838_c0_g1_i9:119-2431(+)